MTSFYILRHAEKLQGDFYNPILRHQDEPISPKGMADSKKLWAFFAGREISAIYISAYLRTSQTIEHVAAQLALTPIIDERLNELDNGLFDGLSIEEIPQAYPDEWKALTERKGDFRFPQGETGEEARNRVASLLDEKRVTHAGQNVIFVCHEGLIRTLMCHITNQPVYKRGNFQVGFCGVTEITYQEEYQSWKLIRFNHTENCSA